jgi:hypothetical protein
MYPLTGAIPILQPASSKDTVSRPCGGLVEAGVGFQQEGTLVFQNLSPLTCPPASEHASDL